MHQRHDGTLDDFLCLLAEDRFVPTAQDFRRLADLLHSAPSINEELVMALCRLADPRLCAFCEAALNCGVPEATDLVEAVLMRRGLVGLLPFVEPRIEEDRNVLWLADLLAGLLVLGTILGAVAWWNTRWQKKKFRERKARFDRLQDKQKYAAGLPEEPGGAAPERGAVGAPGDRSNAP